MDSSITRVYIASPLRYTLPVNNAVSRRVVRLLNRRCPTAVSSLVMPVNVDPIDRHIRRWTSANIGNELFEAGVLHLYSATAIVFVPVVFMVTTSAEHRYPNTVLWRS
jgi:hypothetical protein